MSSLENVYIRADLGGGMRARNEVLSQAIVRNGLELETEKKFIFNSEVEAVAAISKNGFKRGKKKKIKN